MPSFKSISEQTKTIYVPTNPDDPTGEKVKVVYLVNKVSRKFEEELNRLERDKGANESALIAQTYALWLKSVQSWDLTDDEGKVIPLDLETLEAMEFPAEWLNFAIGLMNQADAPDPKAKKS